MRISQQCMSELISPAIQILNEALMCEQRRVIPFHQPLRFQTKVVVRFTQNNEERDLRQDSPVAGGTLGGVEKDLVLFDGLQLGRDRGPAIGDAEVMVQDVEEIPEAGALKGVFALGGGLLLGEQGLVEGLVQVQLGGDAHAVAGQLPAQVGQPEGGDAQGADVLERVEAVEERRGDQLAQMLGRLLVDALFARDVQRRHGNDGREEQRGRLADREQRARVLDRRVKEVPRQARLEQREHLLRFRHRHDPLGDQVRLHVFLRVAPRQVPVLQPRAQRVELRHFVQRAHRRRRHFVFALAFRVRVA